jgi:peptidoglycan/LPS O-acetylase OafA/YrhL
MQEPVAPVAIANRHILPLDGLRGIAILLVMVYHFTLYGGMRAQGPVDTLYYRIATMGWSGVDLFFVLSGFLITGILLDTKGAPGYVRNFYLRRILRIFPLYYATLAVVFFLLPVFIRTDETFQTLLDNQAWYWTYLVNWHIAAEGWHSFSAIGHFWSLAIEEQFYLVWPLVVWLCSTRKLLIVGLAAIVGAFVCRAGLSLSGYKTAGYVFTLARMDTLLMGAMLAALVRSPLARSGLKRWSGPLFLLAGATVTIIALWRGGLPSEHPVTQLVGYPALAIMFTALISLAVTAPSASLLARLLTHPALIFFGRLSYGLYVIHHIVIFFVRRRGFRVEKLPTLFGSQLPGQALYMIVGGGFCVILALLSWHFFETHFLKLKARFASRVETPVADGASGLLAERL